MLGTMDAVHLFACLTYRLFPLFTTDKAMLRATTGSCRASRWRRWRRQSGPERGVSTQCAWLWPNAGAPPTLLRPLLISVRFQRPVIGEVGLLLHETWNSPWILYLADTNMRP